MTLGPPVARVTITLSEPRYRALREVAARRKMTITALIDESLERCGIRTRESAEAVVVAARERAASYGLGADEATKLAVAETRVARKSKKAGVATSAKPRRRG